MALFQKGPSTAPTQAAKAVNKTASMIAKVKKAAAEGTQEWLAENFGDRYGAQMGEFNPKKINEWVKQTLDDVFVGAVLTAVGIERDFGDRGNRVKYDSVLYHRVKEVAKEQAVTMLEKFIVTQAKKLPAALPEKHRKAVEKSFEAAYLEALEDEARKLGAAKASRDINKIVSKAIGEKIE